VCGNRANVEQQELVGPHRRLALWISESLMQLELSSVGQADGTDIMMMMM
jgi:hypothetical protein